jgi:hypothetical protein
MKVVHDTPDRLVLRRRPWLLAILFLFIAVTMVYASWMTVAVGRPDELYLFAPWAFISLAAFLLYCHTDTVTFDRTTGEMRHMRRLLLWRRRRTIPLASIRRARIEEMFGERVSRDATFLRPVLDLDPPGTPPYRLLARTLQGTGARQAADAINAWLRRRRT